MACAHPAKFLGAIALALAPAGAPGGAAAVPAAVLRSMQGHPVVDRVLALAGRPAVCDAVFARGADWERQLRLIFLDLTAAQTRRAQTAARGEGPSCAPSPHSGAHLSSRRLPPAGAAFLARWSRAQAPDWRLLWAVHSLFTAASVPHATARL